MLENMIYHGDCLRVLPTLGECVVDAVVTDPPYGLGFMNKDWDHGVPGKHFWEAILRVAKPGTHLLAFGGTRTFHRLTCAIEDAGWEVRDCLMWLYGTGFPKSLNMDNGVGTALKPAWEPIILARKPFEGAVTNNMQKWSTGGLNIDGCRIGIGEKISGGGANFDAWRSGENREDRPLQHKHSQQGHRKGRWPANLILDDEAAQLLDQQTGILTSGKQAPGGHIRNADKTRNAYAKFKGRRCEGDVLYGDSGGASRFFYCAKASRAEREYGLDHLPMHSAGEVTGGRVENSAGLNSPRAGAGRTAGARNFHPTVKPIALMRYLCRLVTPPGGIILDPFMGSGSTGIAGIWEGFTFIGIELNPEYVVLAKHRIEENTMGRPRGRPRKDDKKHNPVKVSKVIEPAIEEKSKYFKNTQSSVEKLEEKPENSSGGTDIGQIPLFPELFKESNVSGITPPVPCPPGAWEVVIPIPVAVRKEFGGRSAIKLYMGIDWAQNVCIPDELPDNKDELAYDPEIEDAR